MGGNTWTLSCYLNRRNDACHSTKNSALVAKVVKTFGDFVGHLETLDEFRYPRIKLGKTLD